MTAHLTTHVLDTTGGTPAAGVAVTLRDASGGTNAEAVTERAGGRKKGVFSAAKAAPATPGSVKGKAGRGQRAGLA